VAGNEATGYKQTQTTAELNVRAKAAYKRNVDMMVRNGQWNDPSYPCPEWSKLLRCGGEDGSNPGAIVAKFKVGAVRYQNPS
jgi:hypothetical protein